MKNSNKENPNNLILERECSTHGACSREYTNTHCREVSHFGLRILKSHLKEA